MFLVLVRAVNDDIPIFAHYDDAKAREAAATATRESVTKIAMKTFCVCPKAFTSVVLVDFDYDNTPRSVELIRDLAAEDF